MDDRCNDELVWVRNVVSSRRKGQRATAGEADERRRKRKR